MRLRSLSRTRSAFALVLGAAALVCSLPLVLHRPPASKASTSSLNSRISDFGKLPLSFEPNAGQADPAVRFLAHSGSGTLYFTASEIVFALGGTKGTSNSQLEAALSKVALTESRSLATSRRILRLRFVGANALPTITGGEMLPGKINYFVGNDPQRWRTNVPTHSSITYYDLYPGVELSYAGAGGRLKGTYTVAVGANASRIRWRYEGATQVSVGEGGDLHIQLADEDGKSAGELIEQAPVAWQEIAGQRVAVTASYQTSGDGSIGFAIGRYDPARPLVIDPTLTYSTYLGGSGDEFGFAIRVDASGSAYVAGYTNSTDFPTANALQANNAGGYEAFVTKLNPAGSALVYSTYLGGSGFDAADGLALGSDGSVYVTGLTGSTNFPTVNPVQASNGGGSFDVFVTKLNPNGNALIYSTYLGGNNGDQAIGIAVDAGGSAYLAGQTASLNFPLASPLQSTFAGWPSANAFVTKLNPAGSALIYSTYLGGSFEDVGYAIAVDAGGSAYVTGYTGSMDFPLASPIQANYGGDRDDGFVAKLNPAGSALIYSTYLGGNGIDLGLAIALDAAGNAYVTGQTGSTNFPTASPLQASNAGGAFDVFLTKLNPAGSALIYSTYLGGNGDDSANGIAVDAGASTFLTGYTSSTDFPTVSPLQANNAGGQFDVFVTKLNPTANALIYSTYLGGSGVNTPIQGVTGTDIGLGIAVEAGGNAYVIGYTSSMDFPTASPLQSSNGAGSGGGLQDAFVAKIGLAGVQLHFNGNPPEDGSCTGNGSVDAVTSNTCATLSQTAILSTGPAAKWMAGAGVDGAGDRNALDPNWIWVLPGPTTLNGPMTIRWGQTCNAECVLMGGDWTIRLWADGAKVYEQHIVATPTTPNVPERLSVTLLLPTLTANSKFVLQIDPTSPTAGQGATVFYDSQLPCPGATTGPCDSTVTMPVVPQLVSAVSRKIHGNAGQFDIDLPITGNPGIECRSGGLNGDYTLVFTFVNALTNVGGASLTSGSGSVSNSTIDNSDAHRYIVNLTGVTNAQIITITLANVSDSAGNSSVALSTSMGLLLGDTTANKIVSNTDVSSVKAQVAAPVTASNFRNDVNANGVISNTDVSTTKTQVGTALPSPP
jgi:hypothetical protein